MIFNLIKNSYKKSQFEPNLWSYISNPFCISRNSIYYALKALRNSTFQKVLDVGCGTKPYQDFFSTENYIGLEYDTARSRTTSKADFFYSDNVFPFENDEFDLVLCSQVLEHVEEPLIFIKEIKRVMKNGGTLILTAPFCWDEHEQPYDFLRFSSFGMKKIFENEGFSILEQKKLTVGVLCLTQLITGHVYKLFCHNIKNSLFQKIVRRIVLYFIICPINVSGMILSKVLPRNDEIYLDNLIVVKK